MTDALYLDDTTRQEFDGIVERSLDRRVVLDRTAFYPTGGGQPHDTGLPRAADGREWRVTDVEKKDTIYHTVDGDPPEAGTEVRGVVDWDRRVAHMRITMTRPAHTPDDVFRGCDDRSSVNVRQVIPRDAIPSVDDPEFRPAAAYDGESGDEVIVLDVGDAPPRAYPVRYLHYHEIVNDTVDGRPVAVTWCPLCGSAVVYDRRVGDRTLTFGVSGKLADDDLVLYDRETESEWKQSLGRAIDGPLAGRELTVLPARLVTVERFRTDAPDGEILSPPGGRSEASGSGDDPEPVDYDASPYETYFASDGFGLAAHRGSGGRAWSRDDIDPKTVVLGVEADGDALGFPLPVVEREGGLVRARVGEWAVLVAATADGVFAYHDPGYEFSLGTDGTGTTLTADGTRWDPVTGESTDGRGLDPIPAKRLFAFAWQDDHGPDSFYGLTGR